MRLIDQPPPGLERVTEARQIERGAALPGRHKTHYDEVQPVLVDTEGRIYPLIRDRLRAEDARWDQRGRAAVQLQSWGDAPPRRARGRAVSGMRHAEPSARPVLAEGAVSLRA